MQIDSSRQVSSIVYRHDAGDFPAMPVGCLIEWVRALRRELVMHRGEAIAFQLEAFAERARLQWLRHELAFHQLRAFFAEAAVACEQVGLHELRMTAERYEMMLVSGDLKMRGTAEERRAIFARLNENLSARIFDSVLAREIALHPSEKMKKHLRAFGVALEGVVAAFPERKKRFVFRQLKEEYAEHWMLRETADPLVLAFVDSRRDDDATIAEDLAKCLRSSMPGCVSSGVLPHVHLVTDLCHLLEDDYAELTPWRSDTLKYYEVLRAVRSRDPHVFEKHATHRTGILLESQIAFEQEEFQGARAIDFLGGLDIEHLKPPAACALLHGLPFVCGVSAHTMNLLHAAAYLRDRGALEGFEVKYLFLAYIVHLVTIGAHSIQEAAWTAHELDGLLSLGLRDLWTEEQLAATMDPGAIEQYRLLTQSEDERVIAQAREYLIDAARARSFVVDYERLFSAFADDEETTAILRAALRRAWHVVVEEGEQRVVA